MLEKLRQQAYEVTLELVARGVVIFTWGNVSGIDREKGFIVIKQSGVDYDGLSPEVEMDIKTRMLNPSAFMQQYVLDKHYMRKHGPNAYSGQR